jgi:DNA-binding response OmpR family regulator
MHHHILIVEDDRDSRESLKKLLSQLGHDVKAANSAEAAKGIIVTFAPDIAILDVRLPGMWGDAFAMLLRRAHPHVRIVFVSGELRLENPQWFGPDVEFISKPLDFGRLLTSIS